MLLQKQDVTIQAAIFDLDGTLVDTEFLWVDAIASYLAAHSFQCERQTLLELVFGHSWRDIYLALIARFPPLSSISMHTMADELRGHYLAVQGNSGNTMIASSVALMKQLAGRLPVIIVSGSPRRDIEDAVAMMDATDQVRFVLGAEDYEPGKPSPAGFLMGAERLGIAPHHCLVFEDSWAGVAAAKAAGMWCVALARENALPQDHAAADWTLSDLAQFSLDKFEAHLRERRITSQPTKE